MNQNLFTYKIRPNDWTIRSLTNGFHNFGRFRGVLKDHASIKGQVCQVLEQEVPVVCDVFVSPQNTTAPRAVSMQKQDGTMVSKPLEYLWPFLKREAFKREMIVPPLNEDPL